MANDIFAAAIDELGGPTAAEGILKRKQSTISGYIKDGNQPADVCMRIEVATNGKFPAEKMRPDLADVFTNFRARGVAA